MIELTEDQLFIIPECCREGWASCTHVVNRAPKSTKRNIGL